MACCSERPLRHVLAVRIHPSESDINRHPCQVRFGSKPEILAESRCFPLCPRKQTSVSAAAMNDPDPNPFADCDVIVC
jgi:hypothetical protein